MTEFETIIEWFQNERGRNSSPRTVKRYTTQVYAWRDWLDENRSKSVWEADNVDLRVYIKQADSKGEAPTTINQRVSAISKFYQDCNTLEDEHQMPNVPENPYENLDDKYKKLLRGNTKKKDALQDSDGDEFPYLEPDEVAELVENVPAPRLRNELIIKLLFNCGFRRQELAKMELKHLDREDRSIYIPPRKSAEGRTVTFNEGYLGFQLDRWLDHGGRESMSYAPESDFLFPTNKGEHISGRQLNRIVRKAAENAGVQEVFESETSNGNKMRKVTAHTLRHSFAMQMLNSGVDIRKLQTLLGHDDMDTTLIYLQQSKEEAKEQSRMFQPEA